MLRVLEIKNFIIVEHLELTFETGFTAFTGETGAGKSILIDALALALGTKGDPSVIRAGSTKAEIQAIFEVKDDSSTIQKWLSENELNEDGQCLLRRVIDITGKSKAFINGTTVPLSRLRELASLLLDIHGQHAHQSLVQTNTQRELLTRYAQSSELEREVTDAFLEWKENQEQLDVWRKRFQEDTQILSVLEEELSLLEDLDLGENEWELLEGEHKKLSHITEIQTGIQELMALSEGDEESLASQWQRFNRQLMQLAHLDESLVEIHQQTENLESQYEEQLSILRHYALGLEYDDSRWRWVDQKIQKALTLARRFRITPEQLHELTILKRNRKNELSQRDGLDMVKTRNVEKAFQNYSEKAQKLSQQRFAAAQNLAQAVTAIFSDLALGQSEFLIRLEPLTAPTRYGIDSITFMIKNQNQIQPLSLVASGGELSRISLALQVALMSIAQVPTLIFDEVDVGIGGGVAERVGSLLARLGQSYQVLCVTHLPQVAKSAQHHFEVRKEIQHEQNISYVTWLNDEQRINELARMLGGVEITPTTLQLAREMLAR